MKGNVKLTSSKLLQANIRGNDTGVGLFRNTAVDAEIIGSKPVGDSPEKTALEQCRGFLGFESCLELVGALETGLRWWVKSTDCTCYQLPAEENVTCSEA